MPNSESGDAAQSPSALRNPGPPFDDLKADIIIRSRDGIDFRVYKLILTMSSEVFSGMFAVQPTPADSTNAREVKDGAPVVELAEDGHVLELFLRTLYPLEKPELTEVNDLLAVLEALRKYMVERLPSAVVLAITELALYRPELAYALASRHGLISLAQAAARRTLERADGGHTLGIDDGDLEFLTGREYHTLLRYHDRCRTAAAEVAKSFDWAETEVLPCTEMLRDPDRKKGHDHDDEDYLPGYDYVRCSCPKFRIRDNDNVNNWSDHDYQKDYAYFAPEWLRAYMSRCELALQEQLSSAAICSWDAVRPIWESAAKCQLCKTDVVDAMVKFSSVFMEEIEKAIYRVILD
ncbi:hypothetical protein DENSPDRAFT_879533 [Dentipellis sp. KUC8613]|nr:hypothetical protein DENSPDRAFT_879533 [Dentipellis sp. KUC8613]